MFIRSVLDGVQGSAAAGKVCDCYHNVGELRRTVGGPTPFFFFMCKVQADAAERHWMNPVLPHWGPT